MQNKLRCLIEFKAMAVDNLMILNEKLGCKIKREDFVQLLNKLARHEITEEKYYEELDKTKIK